MDATTKKRLAERVRRALTKKLLGRGFVRSKTTFWARPREHVIEFVHLHLYTFEPSFRAHLGIRVLNDDFPAEALNGPASHTSYDLEFSESESSVLRCADEIARFCAEVGEPWFQSLSDPVHLLASSSPLRDSERAKLRLSLQGQSDAKSVQLSKHMFRVA
jgi:hypothetical protein